MIPFKNIETLEFIPAKSSGYWDLSQCKCEHLIKKQKDGLKEFFTKDPNF
jgi:hypothetical protein